MSQRVSMTYSGTVECQNALIFTGQLGTVLSITPGHVEITTEHCVDAFQFVMAKQRDVISQYSIITSQKKNCDVSV